MYKLFLINDDGSQYFFGVIESYEIGNGGISFMMNGESGFMSGTQQFAVVPVQDQNEEVTTIDVESAVVKRMRDAEIARLSEECEKSIMKGFRSTTTTAFYAFSQNDQQNFNQQLSLLILDPSLDNILWKTEDQGILMHSRSQFIDVVKEAERHKRGIIGDFWRIKANVSTINSIEALNNIGSFEEEVEKLYAPPVAEEPVEEQPVEPVEQPVEEPTTTEQPTEPTTTETSEAAPSEPVEETPTTEETTTEQPTEQPVEPTPTESTEPPVEPTQEPTTAPEQQVEETPTEPTVEPVA